MDQLIEVFSDVVEQAHWAEQLPPAVEPEERERITRMLERAPRMLEWATAARQNPDALIEPTPQYAHGIQFGPYFLVTRRVAHPLHDPYQIVLARGKPNAETWRSPPPYWFRWDDRDRFAPLLARAIASELLVGTAGQPEQILP